MLPEVVDRGDSFSLYGRPLAVSPFLSEFFFIKLLARTALDSECSIKVTYELNVSRRIIFI